MSVDILGTSCDQCRSMVQYSFTSTETRRLVRTDSPGRPPRLSHNSWTIEDCVRIFFPFQASLTSNRTKRTLRGISKGGNWRSLMKKLNLRLICAVPFGVGGRKRICKWTTNKSVLEWNCYSLLMQCRGGVSFSFAAVHKLCVQTVREVTVSRLGLAVRR